MEYPEVNIDPSLLRTFEEEKAWLQSYTAEIRAVEEVPVGNTVENRDYYPRFLESVLQQRMNIENTEGLQRKVSGLEGVIVEKQEKIKELASQLDSERISMSSTKQVLQNEINSLRLQVSRSNERLEKAHNELMRLKEEESKEKIDVEKEEIKAKYLLCITEIDMLRRVIDEKEAKIRGQDNQIEVLEKEKFRALSLTQTREDIIRNSFEQAYNIPELTQRSEFYCKKMKEYQSLYLEAKSYESKLLDSLNANYQLEKEIEQIKNSYGQISTAYSQLKKDYEYISIKLKSVSEMYSKLSDTLQKEAQNNEALKREKSLLENQVRALVESSSDSIFTFTSVDDLLVKNLQLVQKCEKLEADLQKATEEIGELKKTLGLFMNKGKEKPDFLEDLPLDIPEYSVIKEQLLDRLSLKNTRLLAEVAYLDSKVKLLERSESKVREECQQLKHQNTILIDKIYSFEHINLSGALASNSEPIKHIESKLDLTEKMLEREKERNKRLQESLEIISGSIASLEERNSAMYIESLKDQEKQKIENMKVMGNTEEKCKILQAELKKSQDKNEANIEVFNIEKEFLREKNIQLAERLEAVETQIMINKLNYDTSINDLKATLEAKQQEIDAFQLENVKAVNQIAAEEAVNASILQRLEKVVVLFHKSLKSH